MPFVRSSTGHAYADPALNLSRYPTLCPDYPTEESTLTLGNLHGNALILLQVLISKNILKLSPDDYAIIQAIYHTPVSNIKQDHIAQFDAIMARATVFPMGKIRFIGNVISDHGGNDPSGKYIHWIGNDYFTLKIIEKLAQRRISIEMVSSRHSAYFLYNYELFQRDNLCPFAERQFLPPRQFVITRYNLTYLIAKNILKEKTVLQLIKTSYLPYCKILSYTYGTEGMTLYSHAPIDLITIKQLVEFLAKKGHSIQYQDTTMAELACTIDAINAIYYKKYVLKNNVPHLFFPEDAENNPFIFLIRQESVRALDCPLTHHGYALRFVSNHPTDSLTPQDTTTLTCDTNKQALMSALHDLSEAFSSEAPYDPILKQSGKKIYSEIHTVIMSKSLLKQEEIVRLTAILQHTTAAIKKPEAFDHSEYYQLIHALTMGRSSWQKKLAGALLFFAGSLVTAVSIACCIATGGGSTPLSALGITLGSSLIAKGAAFAGLLVVGTSLLTGGGALFHRGKQHGLFKACDHFLQRATRKKP